MIKWRQEIVSPGKLICGGCVQMKKFFNDHNQEPPYQSLDETHFWIEEELGPPIKILRTYCTTCMEEVWHE